MSTFTTMEIAASGLSVQRIRMNIIASNLANAQTTRRPDGKGPYRRRDIIVQAVPLPAAPGSQSPGSPVPFGAALQAALTSAPTDNSQTPYRAVRVAAIVEDRDPPRRVYDPSHPDADKDGYVLMPNISIIREMTDLITASRAYEANLATLRTVKEMARGAMEIGR